MTKTDLDVGCLVKLKPYHDLKKFGIRAPESSVPFIDEVGIVVRVLDKHIIVLWQKSKKECPHFPHTLDKIAD
jgi:hypothetical protein